MSQMIWPYDRMWLGCCMITKWLDTQARLRIIAVIDTIGGRACAPLFAIM